MISFTTELGLIRVKRGITYIIFDSCEKNQRLFIRFFTPRKNINFS